MPPALQPSAVFWLIQHSVSNICCSGRSVGLLCPTACATCLIILLCCHVCRYQIQYDVADSTGRAATSLALNITFTESATVTGSFLLIGQAASTSIAQETALALLNTSSVVNAAFRSTVAAVFESWLTETISVYVTQLMTGDASDAALIQATNPVRLGLLSDVLQTDVKVLNSIIDANVTALLADNGTATLQSYAYNVTLQVTVLTTNLLSSVFVGVLNGTSSRRHLLAAPATHEADLLASDLSFHTAEHRVHAESESIGMAQHSRSSAQVNKRAELYVRGTAWHNLTAKAAAGSAVTDLARTAGSPILNYSGSTSSINGSSSHGDNHMYTSSSFDKGSGTHNSIGMYNNSRHSSNSSSMYKSGVSSKTNCSSSGSKAPDGMYSSSNSSSNKPYIRSRQSASNRRLQATQSSPSFPLTSLLQFKMQLTLAAFQGTSGCSTANLAELFYGAATVPEVLHQLCGDSQGDLTFSQALLGIANSSIPLFQVSMLDT